MKDLEKRIAVNREIIHVIQKLLTSDNWHSSLFLKVARRQFRHLLDEAQHLLKEGEALAEKEKGESKQLKYKPALKPDQIEVFISLYHTQPDKIEKWQEMLAALTAGTVGRPVYCKESHVIKALKTRGNLPQEGYVCVYIDRNDMINLPKERQQKDRLGNPLLVLEDQAVKLERIHLFVQANTKHYLVESGKLIPISSPPSESDKLVQDNNQGTE